MLKKVIAIVISLSLIFAVCVMAENEDIVVQEPAGEMSEQVPPGIEELPQGSANIDMGQPGDMQGTTPPAMQGGNVSPEGIKRGQRPQGNFTPPDNAEGFTPPGGGFNPMQNNDVNNIEATEPQTDGNISEENPQMPDDNQQFDGQMPGGMGSFPGNMQNFNGQTQEDAPQGFLGFVKTYSTPVTSVILLFLAFIFVIFYRRKNY